VLHQQVPYVQQKHWQSHDQLTREMAITPEACVVSCTGSFEVQLSTLGTAAADAFLLMPPLLLLLLRRWLMA
jgi:hypothetical protein